MLGPGQMLGNAELTLSTTVSLCYTVYGQLKSAHKDQEYVV